MINNELMNSLHRALKTGELICMLAEAEINNNRLFTELEIKRAVKETNTDKITREDIDLSKAAKLDQEYQKLQKELKSKLDNFINTEEYKAEVLEIVKAKDKRYEELKIQITA